MTVPGLRRTNEISAMSRAHSQTGEKTRSTCVPVIGLRSSFSRSVTANAAARRAEEREHDQDLRQPRHTARYSRLRTSTNGSAYSQPQVVPWNSAVARMARSLRGCGYSRRSVS